jgi:hypothetical protein
MIINVTSSFLDSFPFRIFQILYWLWSVSELVPRALRGHLAEWGRAHWWVRLSTVPVHRGCHDGAHTTDWEGLWGLEKGAAFLTGEKPLWAQCLQMKLPASLWKHFSGLHLPSLSRWLFADSQLLEWRLDKLQSSRASDGRLTIATRHLKRCRLTILFNKSLTFFKLKFYF